MGYFNWLNQFEGHIPKWKASFPHQLQFACHFGFLRPLLRIVGKIFWLLNTLFVPFIVYVSIPQFLWKNWFNKRTRMVHYLNWFLHWNYGIKVVVLSTIKCLNHSFTNRKILPLSLKNGFKPKITGKLELIREKRFSFRYRETQKSYWGFRWNTGVCTPAKYT